ncbi:MAG: hypothetical protein ACRDG3_03490 [Tepidiformaceae bacterium]
MSNETAAAGHVAAEISAADWDGVWVGSGKAQAVVISRRLEADGFITRTAPSGDAETRGPRSHTVSVPHDDAAEARLMLRKYGERAGIVEVNDEGGSGSTWAKVNNVIFGLVFLAIVIAAVVVVLEAR